MFEILMAHEDIAEAEETTNRVGSVLLELVYLYFPPSFLLTVGCFCPVGLSKGLQDRDNLLLEMEDGGK